MLYFIGVRFSFKTSQSFEVTNILKDILSPIIYNYQILRESIQKYWDLKVVWNKTNQLTICRYLSSHNGLEKDLNMSQY